MTPWQCRQAINVIQSGGVIAYPTETVYGLGCDPLDYAAVARICALKQRPLSKGLILLASDVSQLLPFIQVNASQQKKLRTRQPRPTTWIVPASDSCPSWLTGQHPGIAVRITDHLVIECLCTDLGHPLVSTSANPAGKQPALNALKIISMFGNNIDYVIHDRLDTGSSPSTIRDIKSGETLRT